MSSCYGGKVHDFTIFKELCTGFDFSKMKVYVDLGFLGIKKVIKYKQLFIPHKASKKHPLTRDQKEANCTYSKTRVGIENAIAKIKSFFILRSKNRIRIANKLNDTIGICSLLSNFKLMH
ncbi:transposase family protein [Rhodocytophaga rosea]|uniref:transposase family protein n=1 Tax=Rhodocytophaga rosea TaxID=2704465 RepID=UPI001E4B8925